MNSNWKCIFVLFLFCYGTFTHVSAQEDTERDPNEKKVEELVAFLQFTMNAIGSATTSAKEKDVIITQSYIKFFRDSEVQIEDDLVEKRETVTNKDVQAYLKDVDFFFKQVSFTFEIEDIEKLVSDNDQFVYLVRLNRNLNGITIDDDTVNQNITRYIEINYDEEADDLKIVSFYTTKLSESEDLFNWWDELSFEWKYLFSKSVGEIDSVTLDYLKKVDALDSLDLSDNPYLQNIEPVRRLGNLRFLDMSNSIIQELAPLRSHSKLQYFSIRNTDISDIGYLRYSTNLEILDLAGSKVENLEVLSLFPQLTSLDISHTPVDSLKDLSKLNNLKRLNCSYSKIKNLDGLENLLKLEGLNISFTQIDNLQQISVLSSLNNLNFEFTTIDDLSPISNLENIEIIRCENTNVYDLKQLDSLSNLKRIYCDNSGISLEVAGGYMKRHPNVLIVFESEELRKWWLGLDRGWQVVLKNAIQAVSNPQREELARISNIDSLNIEGLKTITDLYPVSGMRYLRYLNCHDTYIRNLDPLSQNFNLEILKLGNTGVEDLSPIDNLRQLEYLDVSNSRVKDILPLGDIRNLKLLDLDGTLVDELDIQEFIVRNPACEVLYKTDFLVKWWNSLDDEWKLVFLSHLDRSDLEQSNYLHKVIKLNSIRIEEKQIDDLSPLNELFLLDQLYIDGSNIGSLNSLKNNSLTSLTIKRSPVSEISSLLKLKNLVELDIGQTAIQDVTVISQLNNLTSLSLAGTKIRTLKLLVGMEELESLDISNTSIKSLNPILSLSNLKSLICYNTPLNIKKIEKYKSLNPDCQVLYY